MSFCYLPEGQQLKQRDQRDVLLPPVVPSSFDRRRVLYHVQTALRRRKTVKLYNRQVLLQCTRVNSVQN
jgi:hypothetical protein